MRWLKLPHERVRRQGGLAISTNRGRGQEGMWHWPWAPARVGVDRRQTPHVQQQQQRPSSLQAVQGIVACRRIGLGTAAVRLIDPPPPVARGPPDPLRAQAGGMAPGAGLRLALLLLGALVASASSDR